MLGSLIVGVSWERVGGGGKPDDWGYVSVMFTSACFGYLSLQ